MKVDFWQLSNDGPQKVVALIARRVLDEGERLLVVSADAGQRADISRALWHAGAESFLANGEAGAPGAERQPVLLSDAPDAANAASHVVFADGVFRDPKNFARAFLLFDETTKADARKVWRSLDNQPDLERAFFEQEDGRWVKKA
ncbi:MAG: DNA polymerase III subunit chi [Erythrobacter sp.]